jgi:pimeloyl-ACP methyl ester carboxylesterase
MKGTSPLDPADAGSRPITKSVFSRRRAFTKCAFGGCRAPRVAAEQLRVATADRALPRALFQARPSEALSIHLWRLTSSTQRLRAGAQHCVSGAAPQVGVRGHEGRREDARASVEIAVTVSLDRRIRSAEDRLFETYGLRPVERFVDLPTARVRLRVLGLGTGPPLVFLHGVSLAAAAWAPLLRGLAGYRIHLVELPGHGLSGPVAYRVGAVREHTLILVDDLFDALELERVPVIAHSLGGMFALWHAAARSGRIAALVAMGSPAVALPGSVVRMPLSAMTVPGLGRALLRNPSSRRVYRYLLGLGIGRDAASCASDDLLDVLRFAARRPGNARTVESLMHAINHARRPRPESVMSDDELHRIATPTMFCWGERDVFLDARAGRRCAASVPGAAFHQVRGGHAPWFEDPGTCSRLAVDHLSAAGYAPQLS